MHRLAGPSDPDLLVGEPLTWTATATDCGATPVYQFSAAPHGGAFDVVRDFSPAASFAWTPMQEGAYDIKVTVKDGYLATETTSAVVVDEVFVQFAVSARSPITIPNPLATDLQGNVMWYFDPTSTGLTFTFPIRSLVPGGTVLLVGIDPYTALPNSRNVLREVDLAGNAIRETNLAAINAQLTALGHHDVIHSFTNDVQRLPDGRTAAIGITQRTIDVGGTPTDYNGMSIVVLDDDLRVTWAWNGFDHLDVNRAPCSARSFSRAPRDRPPLCRVSRRSTGCTSMP